MATLKQNFFHWIKKKSDPFSGSTLNVSIFDFLTLNFLFCIGVYSWLTMLWQVTSKGTQPHICKYPFSPNSPPIQAATWHWAEFPVLFRKSLLVIPFTYSILFDFNNILPHNGCSHAYGIQNGHKSLELHLSDEGNQTYCDSKILPVSGPCTCLSVRRIWSPCYLKPRQCDYSIKKSALILYLS